MYMNTQTKQLKDLMNTMYEEMLAQAGYLVQLRREMDDDNERAEFARLQEVSNDLVRLSRMIGVDRPGGESSGWLGALGQIHAEMLRVEESKAMLRNGVTHI